MTAPATAPAEALSMRPPRFRFTVRRMMVAAALALLLGTAAILLASPWLLAPRNPHAASVAAAFGGPVGLAVLERPDSAQAYRLGDGETPEARPILAGPVPLPAGSARRLGAALASPRSYNWDQPKGCVPSFEVRLSLSRGRDRLDLFLCLRCSMVEARLNGQQVDAREEPGGGVLAYDPIRPVVVGAIRPLFPDDPAIQAMGP